MTPRRVVIAGASLAGLTTAEGLRRGKYDGEITVIGEEAWSPYDRPPLSKELLVAGPAEHPHYLRDESALDALQAIWLLGRRCLALDVVAHTVTLDDGSCLGYDTFVIATGARARTLPQVADRSGVHTLRTFDDCLELHRGVQSAGRIVVVGGGFIGCEVAASLRQQGREVTVVEVLPTLLAGPLGIELGEIITRWHRDHGVDVICGTPVVAFPGEERVEGVLLADGREIATDVLVLGLGATPNVEWLTGSGVVVDNGVVCDAYGRTNAPDVFAAGDVARAYAPSHDAAVRIEHWTNASVQGAAVGANILASAEKLRPVMGVPYFWSDQFDRRLQYVGMHARTDDVELATTDSSDTVPLAVFHREGVITAAVSLGDPRLLRHLRQALGQPVGTHWPSLVAVPR